MNAWDSNSEPSKFHENSYAILCHVIITDSILLTMFIPIEKNIPHRGFLHAIWRNLKNVDRISPYLYNLIAASTRCSVALSPKIKCSSLIVISLPYQVIPGNLQKYVSTNRSLLQCKTLPTHFSNNMMVSFY